MNTGSDANRRVDYFVQRGKSSAARNRHFRKCQEAKIPTITVEEKKRGVHASVDTISVDPAARFDVTADVKIRAVFGQRPSLDCEDGRAVGVSSYYSGVVPTADIDAIGGELASIVEDALPFMAVRTKDGFVAQATRHPDWTALAEIYAAGVHCEQTRRAIETGYFAYRGVRDSDSSGYEVYCRMAGRPAVFCRMQRGRGEIAFSAKDVPETRNVDQHIENFLVSIVGPVATKAAAVRFYGSPAAARFVNVPETLAERVAAEVVRSLGHVARPDA